MTSPQRSPERRPRPRIVAPLLLLVLAIIGAVLFRGGIGLAFSGVVGLLAIAWLCMRIWRSVPVRRDR